MSDVEIDEAAAVESGVALAEARKERLTTDPEALRKLVAGAVDVEDWVTTYPNKSINLALAKHEKALFALKAESQRDTAESDRDYSKRIKELQPELDALTAEGEELRAKFEESAVTLHFIGLGKKAIKRIRAEIHKEYPLPPAGVQDDPTLASERQDAYECAVIAAHIQHAGFTREDVETWKDKWPNKAFGDLWACALRLSIADDYLAGVLDVDFS